MDVSRLAVVPVVCAALATAGMPLPASGAQTVACEISAWSTDTDPNGLNVRAGPGTGHPVIATLPPPMTVEGAGDDEFAPEVWITGSQDGWFRIKTAIWGGPSVGDDDEPLFEREGWVSGSLLGLAVEGQFLYSGPSHETSTVVDFFEGGGDYVVMHRLHACEGRWVEGEATVRGETFRGWASDVCASQLTTCP